MSSPEENPYQPVEVLAPPPLSSPLPPSTRAFTFRGLFSSMGLLLGLAFAVVACFERLSRIDTANLWLRLAMATSFILIVAGSAACVGMVFGAVLDLIVFVAVRLRIRR